MSEPARHEGGGLGERAHHDARDFQVICELADIVPESGVCALLDGRQIAVFRLRDALFAIGNHDPASDANVLSRGIVGDIGGELVVASPIYKHHYSLIDGRCLEDPALSVPVYPCRVVNGEVQVQSLAYTGLRTAERRKLVVVGNGMAAMRVLEELLELAPQSYDIAVFGAEPHGSYNRILLSPVLAGERSQDEIVTHPPEWYADRGITLHAGDPVVQIDRARRVVISQQGISAKYDRLLIATGSLPVMLPIPGRELPGVLIFRELADVEAMLSAAQSRQRAVVIGGGLLGLEAATGLLKRGMDVTVVHVLDQLMERQLDADAAGLLRAELERRGLRFKMPARTSAIVGEQHVSAVRFEDGSELPADLVVMAVGVRPNISLGQAAGLRCERGILVDDTLQTFDPTIYAVGECVQHRDTTFGLVAPLWEQARVCAAHLAERGVRRYSGSQLSTHLKVSGIDVYSAGDYLGDADSEALVLRDPGRGVYKRLVLKDNRVRGAVLYGDTSDGAWYFDLINEARDVGAVRHQLLFGEAQCQTKT